MAEDPSLGLGDVVGRKTQLRQEFACCAIETKHISQKSGVKCRRPECISQGLDLSEGLFQPVELHIGKAPCPQGRMIDPRCLKKGLMSEKPTLSGFDVAAQPRNRIGY